MRSAERKIWNVTQANVELVSGLINCVRIGSRKNNFLVYNCSNWFPNKITYRFISLHLTVTRYVYVQSIILLLGFTMSGKVYKYNFISKRLIMIYVSSVLWQLGNLVRALKWKWCSVKKIKNSSLLRVSNKDFKKHYQLIL